MTLEIYKPHKKKIILAIVINLGLIISYISLPKMPICREHAKSAKLKSRLKQIGLLVSLYFEGQEKLTYPKNPSAFKIDPKFFYTNKTSNWYEINLNSPYYFFPDESHKYTGSPTAPLATNWEPIINRGIEFFVVVWEDGHISQVSRTEQLKLFLNTYKGRVSKELYSLMSKNNQALQ